MASLKCETASKMSKQAVVPDTTMTSSVDGFERWEDAEDVERCDDDVLVDEVLATHRGPPTDPLITHAGDDDDDDVTVDDVTAGQAGMTSRSAGDVRTSSSSLDDSSVISTSATVTLHRVFSASLSSNRVGRLSLPPFVGR